MTTWGELRGEAERALRDGPSANPAVDAGWIVAEVSGDTPAMLSAARAEPAPARAVARVDQLVARRRTGEPLQYVLGSWSFRGLDLMVDRRVLIPRPETEVTAQVAIDEFRRTAAGGTGSPDAPLPVADLGTGSGAIALALAKALPEAEVWASDVSPEALAVARANLAGLGSAAARVRLVSGDWFSALPDTLRGRFRVVVANPPYVAEPEVAGLPREVADYEPRAALVSGPTGLEALRHLVVVAPEWLAPDGVLVCELAPHQAAPVTELARDVGYAAVEVVPDLAGRERVLVARRGAAPT